MSQESIEDRGFRLDDLFDEVQLGALRVRNRFAMAPMTRMKSPGGVPNEENVEYYRAHAAGGVGLIITEGTYVRGPAAGPAATVPHFYGDDAGRGGGPWSRRCTPRAPRSSRSSGIWGWSAAAARNSSRSCSR